MTTLLIRDSLVQLGQEVDFQYIDMGVRGTQLEQLAVTFVALAAVQVGDCMDECACTYRIPDYCIPHLPLPIGVITFGVPSRTTTTINQPFTYSGNDADGFYFSLDNGVQQSVTDPIQLTGLTPDTLYNLKLRPYNINGTGSLAQTYVRTLPLVVTTLEITFGTPIVTLFTIEQPFSYNGTAPLGFVYRINGVFLGAVESPIVLTQLPEDTSFEIQVVVYTEDDTGVSAETTVSTLASIEPPTGVITFGTAVVNQSFTSVSQPFTYSGSDAVVFMGEVNEIATEQVLIEGVYQTVVVEPPVIIGSVLALSPVVSPIVVAVVGGHAYQFSVTPVNNSGSGSPSIL